MARNDLFLYQAPIGQDIIANDGSSFSAPTFAMLRQKLRGLSELIFASGARKVPLNYDEDAVQAARRYEFDFKEWSLVACSVDGYGEPKTVLLVHQTHLEEGYLLSFPSCLVEVAFYRGFLIEEFPGESPINGEDFLLSIGIKEEYAPLSDSYDDLGEDDEEAPIIEVIRPKFTANKKHKILNLGGTETVEAPEEEDEESALEIHVDRPAFSGNRKAKIPNLGSSGRSLYDEEEEEAPYTGGETKRPEFEARSNKKPRNLDQRPKKEFPKKPVETVDPKEKEAPAFEANRKGKIPNLDVKNPHPKPIKKRPEPAPQKPQVEPIPEEKVEKPVEPIAPKAPSKPIERPAFEARRQGGMRNLDNPEANWNKTIEIEAVDPRPERKRAPEPKPLVEEKNWASIDVFKLKPRVFNGEQAIIASPKDPHAVSYLEAAKKNLAPLTSIRISKSCVFVPSVLEEDDPALAPLAQFAFGDWSILALTIDKKEEPIYALLQKKGEDGVCTLVSFKHGSPHIVMFSKKGASVDDRALPYYGYDDLKKAVFGK